MDRKIRMATPLDVVKGRIKSRVIASRSSGAAARAYTGSYALIEHFGLFLFSSVPVQTSL
jgi:hypothetical protein